MNEEGQVCTGKSFSEALTLQGIPAFRDFTIRDPRFIVILLYFLLHKSWIWWTLVQGQGMLWIFFLITIFIMLQKNAFGQRKFQISCTGSKVPFWQN